MCIKREEKQHMYGVGERKTYINIYKKDKYNVCQKMVTRPKVQEQCIYKGKKIKDT